MKCDGNLRFVGEWMFDESPNLPRLQGIDYPKFNSLVPGRVKRNPPIMFVVNDLFSKIIIQANAVTQSAM